MVASIVVWPWGVEYTNVNVPSSFLAIDSTFHSVLTISGPSFFARPSGNVFKPPLNDPTVCPNTAGNLGSRGPRSFAASYASFCAMRAPKTRLPPKGSNLCTLPVAASAESIAGSPAYTPLQNGSMRRSNAEMNKRKCQCFGPCV